MDKTEKGAKYTRGHTAVKLEAAWRAGDRGVASRLEYRIKKLEKQKKEALIDETAALEQLFGEVLDSEAYSRLGRDELNID